MVVSCNTNFDTFLALPVALLFDFSLPLLLLFAIS
jgi:hypothetical protein